MVPYFGDFAEDATVRFVFNTFSSDDPSASVTITNLADADLKVHKDGSVTQIVTDGATIAIDFDSITGNHMVTIDTSVHADYSTGSDYHIRMEGTTVDGATINAFIGHFSIENRFNEVNVTAMAANVITAAAIATDAIGAAELAADAVTEIRDAITGGAYALDTDANGAIRIVDGTGAREINTNSGAIALVDTVTTNTDMLTAAAVNAEVDTALTDIGLDHLLSASVAGSDVTDDSIIAQLVSASATADWDDFVNTTDSLQALRDRGDAAWTTGAGGSDRLLMVDTTIATLSSQTSFTLTAGSTDDDAYNGCTIVIEDVSTATQKAIGVIDDYTGSTKTVTLLEDPAVFTMAATDKVYVLAEKGLKPTTAADYHVDVSSGGNVGIDWANVESPSTAVDLSATDIQLVDTVTTYTGNTVQTGDAFARLGAPTGASVSADIATVDGNVDTLITNVPDVISQANINAEVDTAIETYGLDHLVSASVTGTDITDNSIVAKLVSKEATADWDDFVNTTESLQALRDHIADGTNLTEAGGTGDHLTALATASALSTAQADLDTITDTGVTAVALTSAAITDVWSTDALTEAYAADGAEGTAAQLLYLILSACSEFAVSGTTLTCKQLDGSTPAATYTLDNASSPTSRTRAT